MNSKFRKLKAEEIKCRKNSVNLGGVRCLLYAGKFAVPDILDEVYGIHGWSAESAGDRQVSLSVFTEDGRKISRIGTCDADSEGKAVLSDALTNAGVYFGIGRELYTAPEIFFKRDDLKGYTYDDSKKEGVCYDIFKVEDITYSGDRIASVKISVTDCKTRKVYLEKTFGQEVKEGPGVPENGLIRLTVSDGNKPPVAQGSEAAVKNKAMKVQEKPAEAAPASEDGTALFPDGEKILIGNCKGKTYGEAKDTETFKNFLKWVRTAGEKKYHDPVTAAQFARFRKLAEAS